MVDTYPDHDASFELFYVTVPMKEDYCPSQGTRRSRKPLLLPTDGDIRNQASKEGMKDTFLSDVGYQDDSCSREYEPELKPCCHLFDNEKGIVWSPNAAYNADLSCFT